MGAELQLRVTLSARSKSMREVRRARDTFRDVDKTTKKIGASAKRVAGRWKDVTKFGGINATLLKQQAREYAKANRSAKTLTASEARRSELAKKTNRAMREQARRQLGIGTKRGFDPDAPATNLRMAADATGRFGRAGRQAIGELIGDAGDLEKAIADVANLTDNISESQVKTAIETAAAQFGTDQMTQVLAYYSAVSAGATTAGEAQEVLNAANRLGIVGRADQETATLAVTKAVANFTEENVSAEQAARSLFGAIQGGQLDADDLANAFPRVAGQAALAGLTMAETAGTLAFLSRRMANADEAGTSLASALATVGKGAVEGTKAGKEAERLGIDFSRAGVRAEGGWKGFIQNILNNPKFNAETMGKLFESKQARKGLDLMMGDLREFDTIVAQAATDSDALADGFVKISKTKGFQFKQQEAELEKLKLAAGTELLPVMVEAGKALTPLIKDMSRFITQNPWLAKVAVASVAGASVLSPVLHGMSGLAGITGGRGFGKFAGVGGSGGAAPAFFGGGGKGIRNQASGAIGGTVGAVPALLAAAGAGWFVGSKIDEWTGASDFLSENLASLTGALATEEKFTEFAESAPREGSPLEQAQQRLAALQRISDDEGFVSKMMAGGGFGAAFATDSGQTVAEEEVQRAELEVRRLATGKNREERLAEQSEQGTAAAVFAKLGIELKVNQDGRVTGATLASATGVAADLETDVGQT